MRFGVAMESWLLEKLDVMVTERESTRSEVLRDLVRAEVARVRANKGDDAVAALTLVYDHRVAELATRLEEEKQALGDGVRAAIRVPLTASLGLDVVVMRGPADRLRTAADRMLAVRGVKHGGVEIIAGIPTKAATPEPAKAAAGVKAARARRT